MATNYTTQQSLVEKDYDAWLKQVEQEQAKTNAANVQGYASAQEAADARGKGTYSQYGTVTPEGEVVGGVSRPVVAGTSGADEQFLSDQSYAIVQDAKQKYAQATTQEERDYWHNVAETERAKAGYSGGSDGSMYLQAAPQNYTNLYGGYDRPQEEVTVPMVQNTQTPTTGNTHQPVATDKSAELKNLLDQWKETAVQQQNGQIDYAVQQAVTELERALADAQPQFQEQAESVELAARQAMDNAALYAEARGDKGGIGQAQYNEIQAAQAKNHLAVQQAQTKLSTDTARQIEDLRAQGEFQKADAALEIAQTYLGELINLEKWAAEFGFTEQQFQESLRQWEAEFNLAMQQFQFESDLAAKQFAVDTDLAYKNLGMSAQKDLASMGEAMLSAGIMPTAEQLAAMGVSEAQAQQFLTQLQLESAVQGAGGGGDEVKDMDYDGLFADAWKSQDPESFVAQKYKDYGFKSSSGLKDAYEKWLETDFNGQTMYQQMDYNTLVSYTNNLLQAGAKYGQNPMDYAYDVLSKQGYSDAIIDRVFAQLGQ